jgi:hypothetical protein
VQLKCEALVKALVIDRWGLFHSLAGIGVMLNRTTGPWRALLMFLLVMVSYLALTTP